MENSEVLQEFKALEIGSSFITKNFRILQEMYPNQFIAIEDGKVLVNNSNVEELITSLRSINREPSQILIEFIPQKGIIVLY
ncbi:MAG: DUF5678 domain-containing protein [Nanoarchaeota archaeon]